MKKIRVTTLVLSVIFLLTGSAMAKDRPFSFLAIGDLPYNADQATLLNQLVKQSRKERFEFLMHVGDIQGGGIPCTDTLATNIRDLFRKYPRPVVYTPGDNEWTDCAVDGGDPIERLANLRK
ncbi:MAG: metallophosphoesterase, partial [Planctomycetota bacterium]|nr:metallophosphoesterase [Planctomycetota bacterium]